MLVVLATVLYIYSRSANKSVRRFPLIGQTLGGYSKRRRYFQAHALELFLEGYLKVPFHIESHMIISLIVLSSKNLCGVLLRRMVGGTTDFGILVPYLHAAGEMLVLPLRYADELRRQPDDVVSSSAARSRVSIFPSP